MYKLKECDFNKVMGIFKDLEFNVVIRAIIDGNTPGEIYVDDYSNPKTALIWDKMSEVLVAGDSSNDQLNTEINVLITEQFKKDATKRYIPCFDLYYSEEFQYKLHLILKGEKPKKIHRKVYKFKGLNLDWRKNMPSNCFMEHIDKKFLDRTDLKNMEGVKGWIYSFWHSISEFVETGVGYCIVQGDNIVSWCVSVFVSENEFEFGVETALDYRGKGYAKLTGAVCMEYCMENGITPFWQCDRDNMPSNKTAEGIGFEVDFEYQLVGFEFAD